MASNEEGAAAAAAATPDVIPPDEEAPAEVALLTGLCILPPLQKEGTLTWDELEDAIPLPPLRAEEPVASLRAALGEVHGYAHLGNYRFVLEERSATRPKPRDGGPSLISPYTGRDAVVSVPVTLKSLDVEPSLQSNGNMVPDDAVVLDDYGDLTPLFEKGPKDRSCIRIVLERYDAASVREQVTKVRLLLDGNAPIVTTLAADDEPAKEAEGVKKDGEEDKNRKDESEPKEPKLPEMPANRPVAVDGTNLEDFYYLSCGEEESLYENDRTDGEDLDQPKPSKKKKKGKGNKRNEDSREPPAGSMQATEMRLNELEEKTRVKCTIRYSGFHPPPQSRRLMGDLCYLEVVPPDFPNEPIVNITAVPTGFYVNRSSVKDGSYKFDPAPAADSCFSHELLDCILQASGSLRAAWEAALAASRERAELNASSSNDNPLFSLHRVAVRGNYGGFQHSFTAAVANEMDTIVFRPSWLVPLPRVLNEDNPWSQNSLHEYNPSRTEEDLSSCFGLDVRMGPARDWNEELQSAREMPTRTQLERIERARLIHKVMTEFGEAALLGVKGIVDSHIAPMNPNEPTRSHVYLHNNIFFSRAIDSGVETFKVTTGDRCARKSASRDVQCVGSFHRLDVLDLHTLATVLVDYLGTRFICQSIVPGILNGERMHKLLYGAVEASSPLAWNEQMHKLLEDSIGKTFMVATRPLPTRPLTEERLELVEKMKLANPFLPEKENKEEEEKDLPDIRTVCGPIEAKGIEGSDQRKYILDFARLTPRDANWVPKSEGGTGKWEAIYGEEATKKGKKKHLILETLEDEEWTIAVLRQELVTLYTRKKMAEYLQKKETVEGKENEGKEKVEGNEDVTSKDVVALETSNESSSDAAASEAESEKKEKASPKTKELTSEDHEYMKSLRLNVNLFLPNVKSVTDIDDSFKAQLEEDMERVREVSSFLWDTLLPNVTHEVREETNHQNHIDGASLTDMLHQRGINCRYLGRLASLAAAEERKDHEDAAAYKRGELNTALSRRTMPLFWLELLECEMVARAAKHVLDSYLTENGGIAAAQPAQTVASFLSALMSTSEETAGETEMRMRKEHSLLDEDDFNALSVFDVGGGGDAIPSPVRSRNEVWDDIERQVGRRFRYTLSLYNQSGAAGNRALYIPLLRRICQRTGIRLAAKTYAVGGKCLCSTGNTSGGRIIPSYPISPLDIVEIVPLVKHAAAAQGGDGFVACSTSPSIILPSLHIILPDAKRALDSAKLHYGARALPQALELAQEAAQLYQRVTDSPMHVSILRCFDLTSAILYEAGEHQLSAGNAARALALSVQLGGFDCAEALSCHSTLSHIFLTSGNVAGGVKHLRAAMYLMEVLAGPRYSELSVAYNKLGNLYFQFGELETALRFLQEASRRYSPDRLMEGMLTSSMSAIFASLERYKDAVESEKRTYQFYAGLLGEAHEFTKRSSSTLQTLTRLAVEQGSRQVSDARIREKEAAANAVANQIKAEEEQAEKKQKNKKKKNKKK